MDGDICIIDDLPHIMVCGLLRMTWSPPWDMGLVLEVWITFDAYFNKETCHWAVDFSVFFPIFGQITHACWFTIDWGCVMNSHDIQVWYPSYEFGWLLWVLIYDGHCNHCMTLFHIHTHHSMPLIYNFDIYIYIYTSNCNDTSHNISTYIIYQHI